MMNGKALLAECRALDNEQLLAALQASGAAERSALVRILAMLAEMRRRELALERGHSSVFMFCVRELRYCEGTAYNRTKAAEACAKFPVLLELLEAGELHVTAVALLCDHLNFENHQRLIRIAKGASRRELERALAGLAPQAWPAERTRVVAVIKAQATPAVPPLPATARPVELELRQEQPAIELRTEHRFTVSGETEAKLIRARKLLSHRVPMGEVEAIFDAALDALLDRIDPARRKERARPDGAPRPPERQTRRVPEWVKRRVRERDGDRCAFVSREGARCEERRFLQFDHIKPWSEGGSSDDPDNIRQACGVHNRWRARAPG